MNFKTYLTKSLKEMKNLILVNDLDTDTYAHYHIIYKDKTGIRFNDTEGIDPKLIKLRGIAFIEIHTGDDWQDNVNENINIEYANMTQEKIHEFDINREAKINEYLKNEYGFTMERVDYLN